MRPVPPVVEGEAEEEVGVVLVPGGAEGELSGLEAALDDDFLAFSVLLAGDAGYGERAELEVGRSPKRRWPPRISSEGVRRKTLPASIFWTMSSS